MTLKVPSSKTRSALAVPGEPDNVCKFSAWAVIAVRVMIIATSPFILILRSFGKTSAYQLPV